MSMVNNKLKIYIINNIIKYHTYYNINNLN